MNDQQRAAMQMALGALNAMLTHMGMDEDAWNKPTFDQAREAITALREALRNASERMAQPQGEHKTDGSPCWCNPEVTYENPETGAKVIVHKEPQGEPVAKVIRNEAGQIAMQKPDGSYFDMSKHIGQTFYTEPTSLEQILHDPENQPSQYGTVPMDYPEKAARQMRDAAVKLVDDTPFTNWFRGDLKQAIADLPIPTVEPLVVPQGEPVAWVAEGKERVGFGREEIRKFVVFDQTLPVGTAFYTTPPSVEAAIEAERKKFKSLLQHHRNCQYQSIAQDISEFGKYILGEKS